MEIIPAIDLKDGQAVRLTKGEMDTAKIYSDHPAEQAKIFEDMGATWLHLVDLNGAFAGEPKNLEAIESIRQACNLKLELGGGIRDEATVQRFVDLGIDRLILGSSASKNPEWARELAARYPIVIGIDAKDGQVAVDGWAKEGGRDAVELAETFAGSNVQAIICTDIGRDGMLSGINLKFTESIAQASQLPTIASGGLKDIDDIHRLFNSSLCDGVIVGKAYYEGRLELRDAFKLVQNNL